MFDICPCCGERDTQKKVDADGPYVVCPICGHKQNFLRLPLFVVTGASASGKSAMWRELLRDNKLPEVVLMESDLLYRKEFFQGQGKNAVMEYRNFWLEVCAHVSQSGRPVALFGSASHFEFEKCHARRYFSDVHYLALVSRSEVLADRLRSRPKWRDTSKEAFIREHVEWNQWFLDNAAKMTPPIILLDTSDRPIAECAADIARWIQERLKS